MSAGSLQWIVSGYVLGYGGLLLLGGRAADLIGRRPVFLGRGRRVRRRVAGQRVHEQRRGAHRAAVRQGRLGRLHGAGRALHHHHHVRRGPGAQPRAEHLHRLRRERLLLRASSSAGCSPSSAGVRRCSFAGAGGAAARARRLAAASRARRGAAAPRAISTWPARPPSTGVAARARLCGRGRTQPRLGQRATHWAARPQRRADGGIRRSSSGGTRTRSSGSASCARLRCCTRTCRGAVMAGGYFSFQFVVTLYVQNSLGWSPMSMALAFLPARRARRGERHPDGRGARTRRHGACSSSAACSRSSWPTCSSCASTPGMSYANFLLPTMLLLGVGFALAFPSINAQATAGVA